MDKKVVLKVTGIIMAFTLLGYGYLFFQDQALLSSGKTNTDNIIRSVNEGDTSYVKGRLSDYVGEPNANNKDFLLASTNLDYVANLIGADNKLTFVEGQVGTLNGETVYSGVYQIKAEQGGDVYLSVVMNRQDGKWILSNTVFGATNPFL